MPQENVEVVRAGLDAFVAGDMERLTSLYAPDAKITAVPEGWPEPAPVEGRDAVVQQFARLQEDWEEQSLDIEREAAGRDRVAVELRWTTRGAGSGVPVAATVAAAYRIDGETIAEARFSWSWEETLEAAGLSE